MQSLYTTLLIGILVISGCSSGTNKSESSASEAVTATRNAGDLSYQEVVALVLADTSNLSEWHNSPVASDADGDLSLALEEPCGENDCGQRIYLVNSGAKAAAVTISVVYPLEESPWSLAQVVNVDANSKLDLGCSHLCYGETSVSFDRAIEGSSYLE